MKGTDHKQFRCTYPGCDKVFNRRDYLERHATNHLSVKPYVCVLCNRHFSRKDLYDNHLATKRHARVTLEAEHAQYNNQIGEYPQQPTQSFTTTKNGSPNSLMAQGSRQSLSYSSSDLDPHDAAGLADQPGLPMYAPPIRQPLHLSGPGPGNYQGHTRYAGFDRGAQNANAYSESGSSFSGGGGVYDKFHINHNGLPQYHQDSTYRYYSDPFSMEIGAGGSAGVPSFNEHSRNDMNSWPPSNRMPGLSMSRDDLEKPESTAGSGRFSAYGVSLGLGSSTSSSVSRSEASASTSDDYSSDADGTNPVAAVNERIRRDMLENTNMFANLRETAPEKDAVSNYYSALKGDEIPLKKQLEKDHHHAHRKQHKHDIAPSDFLTSQSELDHIVVKNEAPRETKSTADAVVAVAGDERYAWFFDDVFNTDKAKLGYDRCYSDAVETCHNRSVAYSGTATNNNSDSMRSSVGSMPGSNTSSKTKPAAGMQAGSFRVSNAGRKFSDRLLHIGSDNILANHASISRPLFSERAAKVLSVLRDIPPEIDVTAVDQWIQAAWIGADSVKHILHPATFDPNTTHLSLLAVLALIGMSLSEDKLVSSSARRSYSPVFLYAYESLVHLPNELSPARLDLHTVNKLQAFSLLLRYERLVLLGDGLRFSVTKNSPGKYVTDLFLDKALSSIPHVGDFSTPKKQQPIWATISSEGYMFHQGADPEAQWKEWALIESTKRLVHFSLYCDSISNLSTSKSNPVSIFNMDIHMICPDQLWQARTADEFFFISGPSGMLTNISYLGLIKSLIRFPRTAQSDDMALKNQDLPQIQAPWSVFALKSIAHGLIMIVGKLSGLIPHGDEMLKAVVQSRMDPNPSGNLFSKFDRQLQARLYRGLDVWYHYFSAAYGDVTDQILRVSGSMSIPLRDEFDPPQSEDESGIPQYALIIVLCHYSSFIFVHEDLPVVLQVTSNLKSWLETHQSKSLQMLLDYLYMPLYTNWIKTDEAKGMVSASALYLVWTHAATGHIFTGNHMFLSAMIYISVIVVWLYDFAQDDISQSDAGDKPRRECSKVRLENFQFMDDAVDYLQAVYNHVCGQGERPKYRAINSVLLLAACLLHKRKSTKPLVEMVIQLLSVMDSDHSTSDFIAVVKRSSQVYDERVAKVRELSQATPVSIPPSVASVAGGSEPHASSVASSFSPMDNSSNSSDIESNFANSSGSELGDTIEDVVSSVVAG